MEQTHRSRLPPQVSGQPGNLRVGSSGSQVYLPAAIFSDSNMLLADFQRRNGVQDSNMGQANKTNQEKEDFLQNYSDHTKGELLENSM